MMKRFGKSSSSHKQRGATLLVTLGILTLLGVLIVTFLLTSRLQRQATVSRQHRQSARDHLDEALHLAMTLVEDAFTYPNYTGQEIPSGSYLSEQRLAPVGHWFSDGYRRKYGISDSIAFQQGDVLLSPAMSNAPAAQLVNLLTPKALSLVPPALTNGLDLSASASPRLRSGWQSISTLLPDTTDIRLNVPQTRAAFAVFNCSGFLDANTFISGPTTQKLPRACFDQSDVSKWLTASHEKFPERFEAIDEVLDLDVPEQAPFFHLSYDPGPDIYPLHYDCFETCPTLGTFAFGSGLDIDLNTPLIAQVLSGLTQLKGNNAVNKIRFQRFTINSVSPFFRLGTVSTAQNAPWYNDAGFKQRWLDPVIFLLDMMKAEEPAATRLRWQNSTDLAWSIANFMDNDRIPQISDFVSSELPTHANYAVEDVPLINKISIFNLYDEDGSGVNPDAPKDPGYYDLPHSGLSNHYAVAVELWYPFAPNPPPDDCACYVGIYTNALDISTTTNRPWTRNDLRDWFNWNTADNSNSVMRTLFNRWAAAYTESAGSALNENPLWQTVTNQNSLWFTTGMTNHPSWPPSGTNGTVLITESPVWQAFYPDTYDVVSTNTDGTVTTNVYTYTTATNTWLDWVSETDGSTNRLAEVLYSGAGTTPPYSSLVWTNLTAGALTTNIFGAFTDSADQLTIFYSPGTPGETNHLQALQLSEDGTVSVVVSNGLSGAVGASNAAAFALAPWPPEGDPAFSIQTNLTVVTEVQAVEPLPMPEGLGRSLAALFAMMPTNSAVALFDFLMRRPQDYDDQDWNDLFDYLDQNDAILTELLPSKAAPTLGNMTVKDRHALWPKGDIDTDTVELDDTKLTPAADFQGYFWTVYPKRTIHFMNVLVEKNEDGSIRFATTNYYAVGKKMPNAKDPNTIWIRPAITVSQTTEESETEITAQDTIVDEALLTDKSDNKAPVWGWQSVTNLCIPDPRRNAYAKDWRGFDEPWQAMVNTTNLNTGVCEMPFIHFDKPFQAIGELGHIYASYQDPSEADDDETSTPRRSYDTLTFSTRSGAALLDLFTLSPTNRPKGGLVQANTQERPAIRALLSDVSVGWTNKVDGAIDDSGLRPLRKVMNDQLETWADIYTDALTNAPYSMGWRSFADMMPNLSTNRLIRQENVWGYAGGHHAMHDYTEDVLRDLIDKVSFRQNVFVIVVAAQTLSPSSTENRPVVLADQRAAVTVIRDAYTGRWTVRDWRWLTE